MKRGKWGQVEEEARTTWSELRDVIITTFLLVLEPLDYKYYSVGTLLGGCSGQGLLKLVSSKSRHNHKCR